MNAIAYIELLARFLLKRCPSVGHITHQHTSYHTSSTSQHITQHPSIIIHLTEIEIESSTWHWHWQQSAQPCYPLHLTNLLHTVARLPPCLICLTTIDCQFPILANLPTNKMQIVVFDLDYTIWQPEMYQIDGPPKLISFDEFQGKQKRKSRAAPRQIPPGSTTIHKNKVAVDRRGTPITVFDGASHALSEINRLKKERMDLQVAISSRTDEPGWAYQLMKWLVAADGTPLSKCFDQNLIEISYADKSRHFESLNRKTGIPFENMVFFDNEYWNIQSVGQLGVKCYHTPNGMTRDDWNLCLEGFGLM